MPQQSLREKMVADQLQRRGIEDPRVLQAMAEVPREMFVPDRLRESAYSDSALPIDCAQTISQPYTVAFMCQELRLSPEDRVLEIGTGSGYGAAVLSRIARTVYTIERIPELAEQARTRLWGLGYDNVFVHVGDGTFGLPEEAPFNAICVTAAAAHLPPAYQQQLAEGGRLVIPLAANDHEVMTRITRHGDTFRREPLGMFNFVPLIGEG